MNYMILDSAGNAVEAFDTEREARAALIAFVREDAEAGQHLAILAFDEEGEAFGEPVTVGDLIPELAMHVTLVGSWWMLNPLTFVARWSGTPLREQWETTSGDGRPVPAH